MGCFPSSLGAQRDGYDKLSDTSQAYSGNSADSTVAQVNSNHREEPDGQDQSPCSPREAPVSPRTALAERLWARWHAFECPDLGNCAHSFNAVFANSPIRGSAPPSPASSSDYTLRGSKKTSPNRSSIGSQLFKIDQTTDSFSTMGNRTRREGIERPQVAMLRRTWSEPGYRPDASSTESPPHTA
ncbi:hypothetical protein ACHAPU_008804 [Fusarium lateritium]